MRFIFANFSAIISFNAYYKHYEIRQDMNCLDLFSEVQFLRAIIMDSKHQFQSNYNKTHLRFYTYRRGAFCNSKFI